MREARRPHPPNRGPQAALLATRRAIDGTTFVVGPILVRHLRVVALRALVEELALFEPLVANVLKRGPDRHRVPAMAVDPNRPPWGVLREGGRQSLLRRVLERRLSEPRLV